MRQAMRKVARRRLAPGFSLLELMLVLAIIGVLTAIVAVNVVGAGGRAKARATMTSMTTIKNALSTYNLDNSAYPAQIAGLQAGGANKAYLDPTMKLADGWGRPFYYATPGLNGNPYDLISFGEDAEGGTADDINVWTMSK